MCYIFHTQNLHFRVRSDVDEHFVFIDDVAVTFLFLLSINNMKIGIMLCKIHDNNALGNGYHEE